MAIVGAVQMNSGGNKKENLKKAELLLREGVVKGARFLALPENFSFMGKDSEKIEVAENLETGETVDFLKKFAADHGVWLLGGTIPLKAGENKVYNTSLLINDHGEVAARYDKIHLFDVQLDEKEVYRESDFVQGGSLPVVAKTPWGKAGLSVCYDIRFPELYRKLMEAGAEFIFLPAAFTVRTGEAHWEVLLRARAIENQVYMIAPAQCGVHPGGRMTYGNSMIVDPWGKILARAGEGEGIVTAELDSDYREEVKSRIPCLKHRVFF